MYKEFAATSVNKHGRRLLICPLGYRYGPHETLKNGKGIWWRCAKGCIIDEGDGIKRCQVRVRTKMIDGYEMIETVKLHSHPPLILRWCCTCTCNIYAKRWQMTIVFPVKFSLILNVFFFYRLFIVNDNHWMWWLKMIKLQRVKWIWSLYLSMLINWLT